MKIIEELLKDISIPRMVRIRQVFPRPLLKDVAGEVRRQIVKRKLLFPLKPEQSVAIAVGSRGITNQPLVVRVLVEEIRRAGGKPFLIPAMGSHAGATAEGQTALLRELGFTEENVNAKICATMEVIELGRTSSGMPVLIDRYALEADHLVIVNRIKPHVCYRGKFESGLMKMVTIGLGKQKGADICHNLGFGKMAQHIPEIGIEALKKLRLLFAVAILENPYHETCQIVCLKSGEISTQEPKLLEVSRQLTPRLYFDRFDVLIIDEIGKEISGAGFDTNIVGRYHSEWIQGGPKITRVAILDISPKSKGNGNGIGMADFTTQRAVDKFDGEQTYPNTLTATLTGSVKIPMFLANDRLAVQACLKTVNLMNRMDAQIVRIKNTLMISEIEISENMLPSIKNDPRFEVIGNPTEWCFNSQGNLF